MEKNESLLKLSRLLKWLRYDTEFANRICVAYEGLGGNWTNYVSWFRLGMEFQRIQLKIHNDETLSEPRRTKCKVLFKELLDYKIGENSQLGLFEIKRDIENEKV